MGVDVRDQNCSLRLLYERREPSVGGGVGRCGAGAKKKVVGSGVFFAKMSFSLRRESQLASTIDSFLTIICSTTHFLICRPFSTTAIDFGDVACRYASIEFTKRFPVRDLAVVVFGVDVGDQNCCMRLLLIV